MNPVNVTPSYFCKIHFNIILPYVPRSSKWSLSFRLFNLDSIVYEFLSSPMHIACSTPLIPSYFIIIIFINCNWVVTQWQWLFDTYTKYDVGLLLNLRRGGLHEKHVVATWNLANHLSIRLKTQGNQVKPVLRWLVSGPSNY